MTSSPISIAEERFATGRVVHAVLPPHAPLRFASTTVAGSIGVSFTAHRRAARRFETAPVRESDIAAGDAFLNISADLEWLKVAEPSESLEFHAQPWYVQQVAAELGASRIATIPNVHGTQDHVIWSIAAALRASLCRGGTDALAASERLHALTSHVLVTYAGITRRRRMAGRLDARRLARVAEYIEAHLDQHIVLEDLSDVAALSSFHFARSFRATTSLTPYQFLTARRMQRARELLTTTRLSTAEIASRVGYVNVAHFREKFVRAFGARPSAVRRCQGL